RRRDGGGDAVRTAMRRAASFCEPRNADVRIAREPLVARLAANAVPGAQLGHRVQPPIPVRDEVQPFLHGVRLRPRHAHLPVGSLEECHPCCRSDLLPMYPVCTAGGAHMKELTRITTDPQVMGGKPCILRLRVTVGPTVGLVTAG